MYLDVLDIFVTWNLLKQHLAYYVRKSMQNKHMLIFSKLVLLLNCGVLRIKLT